jgi:drug/metabolite transporter (DMT)-like permease
MALPPFIGPEAAAVAGIVGAALHDVFCAVWMFAYMGARGRWHDTLRALCTRSGKVVAVGALLGGPIGMTGYALAIANIGAGYTAIISAFYPALGTLLAALFLKEKMSAKQVVALFIALIAVCYMGFSASGATDVPGNAVLGVISALACLVGWGSEAVLCAWGMRDDAVDNQTALHIRETASALAYLVFVIPLFGAYGLTLAALPTPADAGIALAAAAGTASYLCYYRAIASIGAARGMAINISYAAWGGGVRRSLAARDTERSGHRVLRGHHGGNGAGRKRLERAVPAHPERSGQRAVTGVRRCGTPCAHAVTCAIM